MPSNRWGAVAGLVFAMVTRGSHTARLNRFQESDWWRASCMLRGMAPCVQEYMSAQMSRPGFVDIANKDGLDEQRSYIPVQPGAKSRVWGANSSAALPMFEGERRAEVAQRRRYRIPTLPDFEEGANSGVWVVASDPDATITAPAVMPDSGVSGKDVGRSQVKGNAVLPGEVSASRLGDCSWGPLALGESVKSARRPSEKRASEAGYRRCTSRARAPNSRASWFDFDVPQFMASPAWLLRPAIDELRLSKEQQVLPYRFLLASGMLFPTASFRNLAMLTEVIARALEVSAGDGVREWITSRVRWHLVWWSISPGCMMRCFSCMRAARRPVLVGSITRLRQAGSRGRPCVVCSWRRALFLMKLVKRRAGFRLLRGPSWKSPIRGALRPAPRDGWVAVRSGSRLVASAVIDGWQ